MPARVGATPRLLSGGTTSKTPLWALATVALFLSGATTYTQRRVQPVNELPNPYRTVENPFKLAEGRWWNSTSAVDLDIDGTSIWVAERCAANSCADSKLNPVLKFDESGTLRDDAIDRFEEFLNSATSQEVEVEVRDDAALANPVRLRSLDRARPIAR